jgi:hypothetical protein
MDRALQSDVAVHLVELVKLVLRFAPDDDLLVPLGRLRLAARGEQKRRQESGSQAGSHVFSFVFSTPKRAESFDSTC